MAVYFIRNARGHVKIGTAIDVSNRFAALQSANSEPLELIRELSGGCITERWLHRNFSGARLLGEWFTFDDSMMTIVPPPESQLSNNKKAEAIAHFGTQAALARALGITLAAVAQWDEIPPVRQYQIEVLTGGKLVADRPEPTAADPAAA